MRGAFDSIFLTQATTTQLSFSLEVSGLNSNERSAQAAALPIDAAVDVRCLSEHGQTAVDIAGQVNESHMRNVPQSTVVYVVIVLLVVLWAVSQLGGGGLNLRL